MKKWLKRIERDFAAVAFAEAGCPEMAKEFLGKRLAPKRHQSLETFLETVGLSNVRVSYGLARV
ncbi:MAG: hypothetical protein V1689_14525 [Pseudomonadota bacterium]